MPPASANQLMVRVGSWGMEPVWLPKVQTNSFTPPLQTGSETIYKRERCLTPPCFAKSIPEAHSDLATPTSQKSLERTSVHV